MSEGISSDVEIILKLPSELSTKGVLIFAAMMVGEVADILCPSGYDRLVLDQMNKWCLSLIHLTEYGHGPPA